MKVERPAIVFLVLATSLAPSSVVEQDWERVGPELELRYPRDHGVHPRSRTEWWYLTGNLETPEGRSFGFQLTFFRSGLDAREPGAGDSPLRARDAFAGHLVIADVEAGRVLLAERLRRGSSALVRASPQDLDLELEGFALARREGDLLALSAADAAQEIALALELRPTKPLVLHGERGLSRKGPEPGNASAYASWTRLRARGSLSIGGRQNEVEGSAWYDHEFGTSQLGAGVVGWDWFALQLDDGRELMLYALRRADGGADPFSAGTLVEADGRALPLGREDFRIEALAHWTSPRSGARYPAAWRIELPRHGLRLEASPRIADCELDTRASTGVTYWEGPIAVRGSSSGRGYAELVGYAGSMAGRF